MTEIVFLLEELSSEAFLREFLGRVFGDAVDPRFITFEGKNDLEKKMLVKIRAYRNPDAKFIVIRDKDSAPNYVDLKKRLHDICVQAGRPEAKVRIFCHELETIYLGDLAAVERALDVKKLSTRQKEAKYRDPDRIASPSGELKSLTDGRYQKVGGSRAIGKELDVQNNTSKSFHALLSGLRDLVAA